MENLVETWLKARDNHKQKMTFFMIKKVFVRSKHGNNINSIN